MTERIRRAARMADAWFTNPHQTTETIERQLGIYRQALEAEGKPDPAVLPMMRECFVAETKEKAIRLARPYLEAKCKSYHAWGQDKSMAKGDDNLDLPFDELIEGRFLLGSPDVVAAQIADYNKRLSVNVIIPAYQCVGTPHGQVLDALHLFTEEVMPKVKSGNLKDVVNEEIGACERRAGARKFRWHSGSIWHCQSKSTCAILSDS